MIEIVEYRSEWPRAFTTIAGAIRQSLGPLAHSIHHIGSTAVEGMPAKDIVDIQLTVVSLDAPIKLPLQAIGYEPVGIVTDHMPWGLDTDAREMEKAYYRPPHGVQAHLHVRSVDRLNRKYALVCRDYLRSHAMAAAAYAEIKKQLAKRFPHDADAYYDVKDPVFDVIVCAAFEWADSVGWTPPPTDA